MGGRGTFAAGKTVDYVYKTVGKIYDVKVLEGIGGKHALPEESHSSNAYIKLRPDGTFHEMRIYGDNHEALLDIAPVLNALSAKKKPIPYRDTPIPVTESESKRAEEAAKAKKIKITKDAIYAMMASVNKQFEKGGNDDGN
jgi:hypothetical protein